MSITQVGTTQIGTSNDGGDVTIDLTEGGAVSLQENDVVVVQGGHSADGLSGVGPNTIDYTVIFEDNDDGVEIVGGAWYKVLGSTPDASVECEGGGDAKSGVVYTSVVLRGVDTSNVLDVIPVIVSKPTGSGVWDSESITTVTDGAWVITMGFGGSCCPDINGAPTGYANFVGALQTETNRFGHAVATKEVTTAGAEDPGAFDMDSIDRRLEATIAIRPDTGGGGVTVSEQLAARQISGLQPVQLPTAVVGY